MTGPVKAVLSVAGRLMLVTIFVMSALGNKIPKFGEVAGYMESAGVPVPQVSLVLAIAFLLVGGASVLVGYKARVGAGLLLVFLVLATYFFHAFWAVEPEKQPAEMINFMKNLALMGAMVFVIANGPGAGSVEKDG